MDVNRAQSIAAVNSYTGGNQQNSQQDGRDDDRTPHDDEPVVEVDGIAADITPAVQTLLDNLAAEIEPLRAQLALAEERERQLKADLAKHAFLPVPGRREFVRELNHVLNHLGDLTDPPHLALLHVSNADAVRADKGRAGLDQFLVGVAEGINRRKLPTDVLGNLGGNDFALLMLDDTGTPSESRLRGLVKSLVGDPITVGGQTVEPMVRSGFTEIRAGMTPEAIIQAADRTLSSVP